ncbi:DEAD box protein/DEAH protein box helicase family protein [Aphelenchoides avenae]|nr:DEAD box protein/DEAH protein box helicase family protein [Aphelenchus avenae]
MAAQTITQFMDGRQKNTVPLEEQYLLNKILNEKLNLLHEGDLTISKLQPDPTSPLYSNQSFDSLRLKPELIRALQMMGFHQPSKIQEASLLILLCEPKENTISVRNEGYFKAARSDRTVTKWNSQDGYLPADDAEPA